MYATQAQIENILGRCLTTKEEQLLEGLGSTIDGWIDDKIGASYTQVTETRYYDGGSVILEIDAATNITKVAVVDDEDDDSSIYDLNVDFKARPRNEDVKTWLHSKGAKFPEGIANIAVTATYGLGEEAPDDIKYLASYLMAGVFTRQKTKNLKSESIEGYSRTFAETKMEDEVVLSILNKYTGGEDII